MNLSKAYIFDAFILKYHLGMSAGLFPFYSNHHKHIEEANHFLTTTLPADFYVFTSALLSQLIWQSKITRIYLFMLMFMSLCLPQALSHSECKLPEHWSGVWFQKGVPDKIRISNGTISEKGICRKSNGEKYIFENRSDKCVRCLVISERHLNILQYKETNFCYSKISFDICFNINGDAPLYSLFRVNTSAIKCPFKGPYKFTYSKGINECKEPESDIDECTDDKRLLFKFKACADVSGSESKVEELECIAEWKEGSYKYLVGKLHHNLATSDEDKFRCFVIERNNSDSVERYNIGQSGDASCDGLFSPRDGLRTFKIRKSDEIQPNCNFPNWLIANRRWKTLDNSNTFDFTVPQTFSVYNKKRDVFRNSKCIWSDTGPFSYKFNTSRFVIHTTLGCKSGYACMTAYLREERIVELQIGNIVSHHGDACSTHHFNPITAKYITLTTSYYSNRECDLKGIYSIKYIQPTKDYHTNKTEHNYSLTRNFLDIRFLCPDNSLKLKSNCEEPDQFQFYCNNIANRVKNLKCRGGWKENNNQFFLASTKENLINEHCVSVNIETNEIKVFRNDPSCYRGFDKADEETISYKLINEGQCNQRSDSSCHLSPNHWITILLLKFLLYISL